MKKCPKCANTYDDTAEFCPLDSTPLSADDAEPDPLLGKLIASRYLITEKIAQGGMGAVYKAIQTKIDRACAVKLLTPSTADSHAAIARFNREAQLASKIDSPHAVTIYDFGESEGALYLAMEFIDGISLTRLLRHAGPLEPARAANIVRQTAEALTAAHVLGIVHRDLKPDNIMVTHKTAEADYVKVLDFGIAKAVADDTAENLTQTGFVLGTPVYMSPEQLSGEKLDPSSDVYSLAIIAYEMLTGRLPFEGENAQAITIKRVTSNPIPLRTSNPALSESVERVMMAALTRDPRQRTPGVQQFASQLSNSVAGPVETAGSVEPNQTPGSPRDATSAIRRGRETVADLPARSQPTAAEQAGERVPTNARQGALREQVDAGAPEAEDSSPSAYVTQPSQLGTGPVAADPHPGGGHSGSGVAMVDERPGDVSTGETSGKGGIATQQAAPPHRRTGVFVAIGVVSIVGIIAAAAIGYFLFVNNPKPRPRYPAGNANSNIEANNNSDNENGARPIAADPQAAAKHYRAGLGYQETAVRLAQAGNTQGAVNAHRQAIAEYRLAIAAKPDYPDAHENLGVSLYYTGESDAAAEEYRQAVDQRSESHEQPSALLFTNWGLALFDAGRYRDAATAFGRALEIDSRDYDLYVHRGFAFDNAGDKESARADYDRYLHLAPSGEYAANVRRVLQGREKPPATSGQALVSP